MPCSAGLRKDSRCLYRLRRAYVAWRIWRPDTHLIAMLQIPIHIESLAAKCEWLQTQCYQSWISYSPGDDVLGYYVACLWVSLTEECKLVETDVVTSCRMTSTSSTTGLRHTLLTSEPFMLEGYKMHYLTSYNRTGWVTGCQVHKTSSTEFRAKGSI